MQREGSLDSPTRHPIEWQSEDYLNKELLDKEMSRQFDVCHGCRRCFNLCGSFPKLFDLIDSSDSGEVDGVDPSQYGEVVDDCTLCDMCFMTKCPYVPPHPFNIDFPHLMLRYKAYQNSQNKLSLIKKQMAEIDRNAKILSPMASVVNAATHTGSLLRPVIEKVAHIDKRASIPQFAGTTLLKLLKTHPIECNVDGIAFGEKVVLYATCYGNYHETEIGYAAVKILCSIGVDVIVEYPGCCGMPQLENGNLEAVASKALNVASFFSDHIDSGRYVLGLVPSCSLMLKSEWPLLYPGNDKIEKLKTNTKDISEYLVYLFKKYGAPKVIQPLDRKVVVHIACHARAQNIGQKAVELLGYIPNVDIKVVERCSGHGGTYGMMKNNFDTALKVGAPVVRAVLAEEDLFFVSECPLAAEHIRQGVELKRESSSSTIEKSHPLLLLAKALDL